VSNSESPPSKCANCAQLEKRIAVLEEKVCDLLARLNQNSSNSSRPPSSDPPWIRPAAKKPSGRKPGGQPGHEGAFRQRLPLERVDVISPHLPTHCGNCQALLPADAKQRGEPAWHQVAELPPLAAIVTEHQAHALICTHCGYATRAEFPEAIRARTMGPGLSSFLSYLSGRFHQSRRQVQELVETVLKIPLSLGSICAREKEMSAALAPAYAEALQKVREAPCKNIDETGWNEAGELCWLWAAGDNTVAVFKVDPSRGKPGFNALLPQPQGVLITDRWHAYSRIPLQSRQLCWAHCKRDFQKLVDFGNGGEKLGRAGLKVVREVFTVWRRFKNNLLTPRGLCRKLFPLKQRMRQILEKARDGPMKKAARFSKRMLKCFDALWTFARVSGVEPTNNHAERLLRQAVLWRKRCQRSWSDSGCRFVERVLTVVQTLRLQHRPVFQYLENTLRAHYSS